MTDLYPVIDVAVTMFVKLKLSEKNYFDFLTHLMGSFFSQINLHPPPVPYQPPSVNTHMLLITSSSMCIQEFVHTNLNIFACRSASSSKIKFF